MKLTFSIKMNSFTFQTPCSVLISAPSGGGKTVFVINVLKNIDKMFDKKITSIVWYYGIYQDAFDELEIFMKTNHPEIQLVFREGNPPSNYTEEFADKANRLLIIDDLMESVDDVVSSIFVRGGHHLNLSVFFLTQNLFHKSKHSRTLNLNSHYLILFKNPRDSSQIQHIARQIFPSNSKFLVQSYIDATSAGPYSYLLLDLKPSTPRELMVRSCILPSDTYHWVYQPKK